MRTKIRVITKLREAARKNWAGVALMAMALLAFSPSSALAFDVISGGGLFEDGSGGYGIDGSIDDSIWVGDGAGVPANKVLPDCDDSVGQHLNYDTATNAFSCGTTSSASTVAQADGFTTTGLVNLNGSSVFISPTGNFSATEANVARMPVAKTGTLDNLRCSVDGNPGGTSLKVQMQVTTCGTPATFSCAGGDSCVTLPAGATSTAADTDDLAVTAGQCLVFKATAVGDTAASFIGCSWTLT